MSERTVAILGAGTMGAGIAQVAAASGWRVQLTDSAHDACHRALKGIHAQVDRQVEKNLLTPVNRDALLSRIHVVPALDRLGEVDLVIEAIVEDLAIKRDALRAASIAVGASAILATNTSSLSVTRIAEGLDQPDRLIGMHFFNPAHLMPLVEIVAGDRSDPSAVEFGVQTAREWGKTVVTCKDTPGFIVNRVARGYYLEALRLLGEGVAGIDEIDGVMRRFGHFRMGPFELMDLVGLDVNLAVSTSVWEQMDRAARFAPHAIQQSLVAKGHLGRKTKRGFFDYNGDHPLPAYAVHRQTFELSPLLSDALRAFTERATTERAGSTEQYIFTRILSAVLNEAAHALDQGVASASDIDLAMMKGTNYPKGPLAWITEIGPRTTRGVLTAFTRVFQDSRYIPAHFFS
ncbi:MAG: 3-hydroxyacyl-CoA dehydrogenase NAD-binding domain-containing protein [Planctomycetota bacterium]